MVLSAKNVQRSKSLHEQIYQALRESILSGDLAPGDRLVELQIAEQLNVSRTPIREAIRQLQREELVTADEMGWLRVTTLSTAETMHLYDCRIALEALAVRGACENASEFQLQQLQSYIVKAGQLSTQTAGNSSDLLEVDYQFHVAIAHSSGNTCLVSLLDQVFGKMALMRAQTTRHNPRVLEIRDEHQTIYDAIAQARRSHDTGDIDAAVQAIQSHLTASKARVAQELASLQHQR